MEAAFIMPFVIYLLIGFIFLAYLMYDNCRIEEAVQNQFLSANRWMLHETDLLSGEFLYHRLNERSVFWGLSDEYEELETYMEECIENDTERYFRTTLTDVNYVLESDHITLDYTEIRNIPEFLFHFFGKTQKIHSRDEGFHCPADFTRKYTVFRELLSGNQIFLDLKERLLGK